MKKRFFVISGLIVIFFSAAFVPGYKVYRALFLYKTVPVDDHFMLLIGGGSNSSILVSKDRKKVLLVDTKIGHTANQMKALVDRLAPECRYIIINTHTHADHSGGNHCYPLNRTQLITGNYADGQWKKETGSAAVPDIRVKIGTTKQIPFDDETVIIRNMGQAHTTNDTVVYFQKRKILMTGDIVFSDMHPVMITMAGTHCGKWIHVLNTLIKEYSGVKIVPGHGPVSDGTAIKKMRDYFIDIKQANDNKNKLNQLKHKYRKYLSIPFLTGFEKTVAFIRKERELAKILTKK